MMASLLGLIRDVLERQPMDFPGGIEVCRRRSPKIEGVPQSMSDGACGCSDRTGRGHARVCGMLTVQSAVCTWWVRPTAGGSGRGIDGARFVSDGP